MKKLYRLLTVLVVAFGGLGTAQVATADVSYNVGYVSEYYFRGILQKSSSASAGIDYEEGGFYIGAWGADVGDGIEYDIYLGYGIETEAGLSASLGFTTYQYTGDTFDDEYNEGNLNLGYGIFSLEYKKGTSEGFGTPSDYDFIGVKLGFDNEKSLQIWHKKLLQIFPNVDRNTAIIGIKNTNQHSIFYLDKKYLGTFRDKEFTKWFFDIWLSEETSEPKLF